MEQLVRIEACITLLLLLVRPAQAQLDNRAFTSPEPGRSRDSLTTPVGIARTRLPDAQAGELRIGLNAFTFFKDNEYFNKIANGYTFFGTQLNPQLVYYPIKDLRLEAGVFVWKDFGNPVLKQVRPTYRAIWTVGNHQFVLGNLRAACPAPRLHRAPV